jgi:hypothetical protein
MKHQLVTQPVLLCLLATLAACDQASVEVDFAAPFPASATDLTGFAPRHWGHYVATSDTSETLLVNNRALVRQQWQTWPVAVKQLDSLSLPHRAGPGLLHGQRFQLRALAADSFQLSWQESDTVFALRKGTQLRRYKGWYYLNFPDEATPGRWQVQRLAVAGKQLTWQTFNPDSLRLRALDTSAIRLRREPQHLFFTLQPQTGHATRQLNGYAGLWQVRGDYQRRP